MRFASFLLLTMLAGSAAAATLYRWVDDEGVVHYSDRPQAGAEEIELRGAQGYEPPQYNAPRTTLDDRSSDAPVYTSVEIVQPTEDEVLWNLEGQLAVGVRVTPRLQRGDRVQIYYDGSAVGNPGQAGDSFEVTDVYRGTHTLEAAVVDQGGAEVLRSATRTFHVRQTSTRNPVNPQN